MLFARKSEKAREKRQHGLVRILAFAAIVITSVFVVYTIIYDNIKIREYSQQLDELKAQTNTVNARNEQIAGYLENPNKLAEYIEMIARDKLDFANGDERIFYVVPAGN